jgi:hypothetical protein
MKKKFKKSFAETNRNETLILQKRNETNDSFFLIETENRNEINIFQKRNEKKTFLNSCSILADSIKL